MTWTCKLFCQIWGVSGESIQVEYNGYERKGEKGGTKSLWELAAVTENIFDFIDFQMQLTNYIAHITYRKVVPLFQIWVFRKYMSI